MRGYGGGGGAKGFTFLTAHCLAAQEGLRLRIDAKNCPLETGGGGGGCTEMQCGAARAHRVRRVSVTFPQGVCVFVCSSLVCKERQLAPTRGERGATAKL